MAYTKTNWQDLPNTTTPVNATNLNNMENGIETNDKKLTGTGEVIVESIRTKNMFDKSTFVQGNEKNASPTIRVSSRQILYLEPGTYTFSCSIPSSMTTEVMVLTDKPGNTTNTYVYDSSWVSSPHTFTIASAGYFCINVRNNNGNTINVSDVINYNFQLEEGSTASSYSEYQALNIPSITSTVLKLEGNYFSTIDLNNIVKTGHVVQMQFRGLTNANIPNNTSFLTVPFTPSLSNEIMIGKGTQYDTNEGYQWGYISATNNIRSSAISSGKWIHINFTYITND